MTDSEVQYGYETENVVPAAGVEPATFRSGGERSNPLSYAGVNTGFKEVHENVPLIVPLVNHGTFQNQDALISTTSRRRVEEIQRLRQCVGQNFFKRAFEAFPQVTQIT